VKHLYKAGDKITMKPGAKGKYGHALGGLEGGAE